MKDSIVISGIQQIGIGVRNAYEAFDWYKRVFGMNIVVFKDEAIANLMVRYTGGVAQKRFAILAMNLQGGGGFEIWQYTEREPQARLQSLSPSDLGILWVKIRTRALKFCYEKFQQMGVDLLGEPKLSDLGKLHFFLRDPFGNLFEVIEDGYVFDNNASLTGGVMGVALGVSSIDAARIFYEQVLEYRLYRNQINTEWQGPGGLFSDEVRVEKLVMKQSVDRPGAFGRLLGPTEVELIAHPDCSKSPLFKDRYWGDLGFIHVCFDVNGMTSLEKKCEAVGHPFTVNSKNSFDMGEAAGQFAYTEDGDGTLIELVETHKVPIFKKMGLYLNFMKRNPQKNLPNWMVKTLRFSRVK